MLGTEAVNPLTLLSLLPTFVLIGILITAMDDRQPALLSESWNRNAGPNPGGLFPALVGAIDGIAFGIVAEIGSVFLIYGLDSLGQMLFGLGFPNMSAALNLVILLGGAFALDRYIATQEAIRASHWYRGWE